MLFKFKLNSGSSAGCNLRQSKSTQESLVLEPVLGVFDVLALSIIISLPARAFVYVVVQKYHQMKAQIRL